MNSTAKIRAALEFIQVELEKVEKQQEIKPKKMNPKKSERMGKYQLMFHSKLQQQ